MPERGLVRTSGARAASSFLLYECRRTWMRERRVCSARGRAANAAAVSAYAVSPFSGSALRKRSNAGIGVLEDSDRFAVRPIAGPGTHSGTHVSPGAVARHGRLVDKKHGYVQRYRVVLDVRVPRRGRNKRRSSLTFLVVEVSDVGHDEHGGRIGARQAAQLPREGGVHPGGGALLERQKFGFVVSGSAEALEIARVRQRRAPVIGETLEVGGENESRS